MDKKQKMQKKVNSFLYNHLWLRYVIDYFITFLASVASAGVFAFGINCFLAPELENTFILVSGGASGLAQNISLIFELCGVVIKSNPRLIYSISYFAINIPLLFLAFFGVGKRFGAFTLVNVLLVTLFTTFFTDEAMHTTFFSEVGKFVNDCGGLAARALFAGICTGASSAIAFKFESSAGGFDILSYYLSLRKGTNTGKYVGLINATIIGLFAVLTGFKGAGITVGGQKYSSWTCSIGVILFSIIYLFTVMLVIDLVNVRNKKVQVSINTTNKDLPRLILAAVPHGATVTKATGAFSGQERIVIYSIISSIELKTLIKFVRELDPNSFISVIPLQQVYGRFFQRPVR